jgi:(p)ppGpp synthase/HD superfamily hydrolase
MKSDRPAIPITAETTVDDPSERRLSPEEREEERARLAGERLVQRAREFAAFRHHGQFYGPEPYIVHLEAVERVLADHGFVAPHWRAAAWLHDVVEDTPTSIGEIEREFGELVAAMVWAVTGDGTNRAERTGSILAKLRLRPAACPLKVADRIANVEAAADRLDHLRRYRLEQGAFARVCAAEVPRAMWERLERALEPQMREAPTE